MRASDLQAGLRISGISQIGEIESGRRVNPKP